MKIYWKDIDESGDSWAGLAVNVQSTTKPLFHLQTGVNSRIRMSVGKTTVFWATLARDYGGVWVIKSLEENRADCAPVKPITSSDIEARANLTELESLRSWACFFAVELSQNSASFLYDGLWLFSAYIPSEKKDWSYVPIGKSRYIGKSSVYGVKEAITDEEIVWIDWWFNGSNELVSIRIPNEESGRVKWWRKKVKEKKLPPILVWYLNCLDAYIIVDGHERLLASVLENVPPPIIVVYSAEEMDVSMDKKVQERIVAALSNRDSTDKRKPMPVERINEVLIQAFDNRPVTFSKTLGWATITSENIWVNEVSEHLSKIHRSDMLEDIVSREG
ncbi:MAG: hypothetical protein OEZ58_06645 [Gammaproteobacteria bacterium]|nr:hypothetical protein [Gammaproteobacteria bacterium]